MGSDGFGNQHARFTGFVRVGTAFNVSFFVTCSTCSNVSIVSSGVASLSLNSIVSAFGLEYWYVECSAQFSGAATVLLSNGTFDVYNYSGTIDLIIDVTAYLTRNIADDVLELQSLTPVMVDSDGKRFATLYTDLGWVVKVNDYWLAYGNEGFQKESNLLFTSSNCSGTPYVDESSVSGFRPDSYGVMPVARIYQEVEGPVSVLQLATELSESTIGDIRSIRSTVPALPFLGQSWQQNGMGCLFRSVSGPVANIPASQVAYPLTITPLVDPPSPPFRVEVSEK